MLLKLESLNKERQDRIINAALIEFAAKGYDGASTISIAKNACISKGLLFHYVNSKKELFLYLYDFTHKIISEDFFASIKLEEKDMLERCRQIAFVKMKLLHEYPQLFNFFQAAINTDSKEVKPELDKRSTDLREDSYHKLFENIDETKFKGDIDIQKGKDLIIWSLKGITEMIQHELKGCIGKEIDYEPLIAESKGYFEILRKSFYK